MIDTDLEVYASATPRVGGFPLGEGHRWVYFTQGDCWEGFHASVECRECGVWPFGFLCYFDLPYGPDRLPAFLRARRVRVDLAALQPCPRSAP